LEIHQKNEERKWKHQCTASLPVNPPNLLVSTTQQESDIQPTSLVVFLPLELSAFTGYQQPSLEALHSCAGALALPSQWVIAS